MLKKQLKILKGFHLIQMSEEIYHRKNRLEVITERNGVKTTIAIETDMTPPIELLKDIIKMTSEMH